MLRRFASHGNAAHPVWTSLNARWSLVAVIRFHEWRIWSIRRQSGLRTAAVTISSASRSVPPGRTEAWRHRGRCAA